MKYFFLSLLSMVSIEAFTQLNVKNETSSEVWVAIGYYESGTWYSQGWWKILPSKTRTVHSNQLSNTKYYVFAEDANDTMWAGKNYYFCAPDKKFKLAQNNCSSDKQKGFFEVNVGQNHAYTLRLTNSSEHIWTGSNTYEHRVPIKN